MVFETQDNAREQWKKCSWRNTSTRIRQRRTYWILCSLPVASVERARDFVCALARLRPMCEKAFPAQTEIRRDACAARSSVCAPVPVENSFRKFSILGKSHKTHEAIIYVYSRFQWRNCEKVKERDRMCAKSKCHRVYWSRYGRDSASTLPMAKATTERKSQPHTNPRKHTYIYPAPEKLHRASIGRFKRQTLSKFTTNFIIYILWIKIIPSNWHRSFCLPAPRLLPHSVAAPGMPSIAQCPQN